ncbi:ankyrin repeat domain-containing protein, partial [bacterium]|nr:ankyrin repeat domain-containing protein [Candidatus Elulimicrobium humile]
DHRWIGELLFTWNDSILEENTNGEEDTREEIEGFLDRDPTLINKLQGPRGQEVTFLHIVASNELHIDIAHFLLEKGADPNINAGSRLNGETPLMAAVVSDRTDLVQAFLENREYPGDVHYPDRNGVTAIDYAYEIGNEEMIELLRGYNQGGKRRHRHHHKKHHTQKKKNKKKNP